MDDASWLARTGRRQFASGAASALLLATALADAAAATGLALAKGASAGMHLTARPQCNTMAFCVLAYARAALALMALATPTSAPAVSTRRIALGLGGLQLFALGFCAAALGSSFGDASETCERQVWWLPLALASSAAFASAVQSATLYVRIHSSKRLLFAKYHTLASANGSLVQEVSDVGEAVEPLLVATAAMAVPIRKSSSPAAASDSSFVSANGSLAMSNGASFSSSLELDLPPDVQETESMRQFCERAAGRWRKNHGETDDHDPLLIALDLGYLLRKAVRLLDEVELSVVNHDRGPAFRTRVSFLILNIVEDVPLSGEKVEVKRRDMRAGFARTWFAWDPHNQQLLQHHRPAAMHAYEINQLTRFMLNGDTLLQDVRYELTRLRGVDVVPPRVYCLRTAFQRIAS